jgi:hypothetical protein
MSPFFIGLILLAAGLAGVFWGYRIFRILLPILAGVTIFLMTLLLLPDNLVLAIVLGLILALVVAFLAYAMWSILVAISGVIFGAALGAAISAGLSLSPWLGLIVIVVLAVVGGILVWRFRDEAVIILTAVAGAGLVASGLQTWFGKEQIQSPFWFLIFIALAIIGIIWQWRRYRHLKLYGMGGPAEIPVARRAAPAVNAGAPVAAAPVAAAAAPAVAAPATAAVVAASAVAASMTEAEPAVVETAAPMVEAVAPVAEVAPAAAAGAVVAAAEVEFPTKAAEVPVFEMESPAEEPVAPEAAVEQPAAEAVVATGLDRLDVSLEGANLATLQETVDFVEGIGPAFAGKLNAAGINTVLDLLQRGATRKGRAELVEVTGIAAGLILKWVNAADLFRVKGVGKQFGELLEAAGVDTVPELAQRNPLNLFNKLSEVNAQKKLAGRAPHQAEVEGWISHAKALPRVVEY